MGKGDLEDSVSQYQRGLFASAEIGAGYRAGPGSKSISRDKMTQELKASHTYIPLQDGSWQDSTRPDHLVPADGEAPVGVTFNEHNVFGFPLQALDCCFLVEFIIRRSETVTPLWLPVSRSEQKTVRPKTMSSISTETQNNPHTTQERAL